MPTVSFQIERRDVRSIVDALVELGFAFEPPRRVTTTLLDTFDGRLTRAGLRLELHDGDALELVLSGDGRVPARLPIDAAPRSADDLPPGPFRKRVARLTDVRALLPLIRVGSGFSPGAWHDAEGAVVATATVHDRPRVVHPTTVGALPTMIDVGEVGGHAKRARRAVKLLDELGLRRCSTDAMQRCAEAAGVDLRGFTSGPTVPLDSEMSATDGCRAVLAKLTAAICANWQGTIDQTDTEFLHDLRIAVRRTRTVLAATKGVLPPVVRDPARVDFAWIADLTGPARDLDVYLLGWDRYTSPLAPELRPALAPVRALLERRRTDAHVELERALRSPRAVELMAGWTSWLDSPIEASQRGDPAERPLGPLVAKRIARAHRTVVERGRLIDSDAPAEQLHDLRKDAKTLRYLLECFGSLLPAHPLRRFVRRLRALQDNLGEHQDADVHVAMLRGIAAEMRDQGAPPATVAAIGQLAEQLDRHRIAARTEFAERFADFDTGATQRSLEAMLVALRP